MKRFLILIALCCSLTGAFAQEICDNGIDDDLDGFIDCFDADCINNSICDGFYIGNDACSAIPPTFPLFQMTLDFASPNETTNHIGRMAIGDMDGDGIPEIVTLERYTKKLFILNGNDGTVRVSTTVTYDPIWEVAIANINNGNGACAEIYFSGIESGQLYFYAYDCNLVQLWKSQIRDDTNNQNNALDPMNYGLADFDGDGLVELYAKDMVFDAHTGARIINTQTTTDTQWNNTNGGPVAVDMDFPADGDLELVVGLKIYDVNLGSRAAGAGSLTLRPGSPTNYFIRYPFNATSVADFNLDGFLDVIASGSDKDGSSGNPKRTVVFFWDVKNNVVKTFFDTSAGSYQPNGWGNGTGRINIADLDGDGKMNVSYVSGKFLYALKEDFTLKWRITINEETSGHTGCTLFDFVGDGSSEIVYRDERFIYIINGSDGSIYSQQTCVSRTQREYPIVADVDADGSTEICVVCGFNDQDAADNFTNLNYSQYSQVRVYKSANEPWVPARRLWNQHGYFNVNINNDLTIPRRQQMHHTIFSTVNCKTGLPEDVRPLNSFLNQSPFLDSRGCPVYVASNIAFSGEPQIFPPNCPDLNFTASISLTNLGDLDISGDIPVTFYTRNPLKPGAVKLNTFIVTIANLGLNEVINVPNIPITGIGTDSVYIVLNDAGTYTIPIPLKPTNTSLLECGVQDIKGAKVIPIPAPLTATFTDDFRCLPTAAPANGVVSAFVPTSGGGQNTTDYLFYWEAGASPAATPAAADFVGAIYNQRPPGTYTVFARHKTVNCGSLPQSVTVSTSPSLEDFDIEIVEDNPYNNCKNPNGQLRAIVRINGVVQPTGKYDYEWRQSSQIQIGPIVSTGHIATNLTGSNNPTTPYTVEVIDKATGCNDFLTYEFADTSVPVVVAASAPNITCSAASTTTAVADVGGVTTGYTFNWYNGNSVKPTPDKPNSATYPGIGAGTYTVVAIDNNTKCESPPFTITVTQTVPPVIIASTTANMTSCDPSQPNGSATAGLVGGGAITGLTFEWFKGQNTLPANLVASTATATASTISGQPAGIYTVRVTDANGCQDTKEATITFNVLPTGLSANVAALNTSCIVSNGAVRAIVSPDVASNYDFHWYIGHVVKATPDFADTDDLLEGLGAGEYTVQAVHKTNHCISPSANAVVGSPPSVLITVDADPALLPSTCFGNGQFDVNVSPLTAGGYNIDIFTGPAHTRVDGATAVASSYRTIPLPSGLYTIVGKNIDSGCSDSLSYPFPFADSHKLDTISSTIMQCAPLNTATFSYRLTKTSTIPGFVESNYDITIYRGDDESDPVVQPTFKGTDGVTDYTSPALTAPGQYLVVAISTNPALNGCKAFLPVTIKQRITPPNIVQTTMPINTACGGATSGNASVTLDIDGAKPETDFTFAWFEGPNTSSPALGTNTTGTTNAQGNIASNLPVGAFTVRVTRISSQCFSDQTINVLNNPPMITIPGTGLTTTDLTLCPPLVPDGGATVSALTENGTNVTIPNAGYTFQWRDVTQALLPTPATPNITETITGLLPGTYYVTAVNALNCTSSQVEFKVLDKTPNSPAIDLLSFIDPTRCVKPNLTGELQIQVTSNVTPPLGHTVNWYLGTAVAGPIQATGNSLTGITIVPGNPDITYTVEAINNSTQCKTQETYVVPVDVATITVSASASPMTFCDNPFDGTAYATVNGPMPTDYDYHWTDKMGVVYPTLDRDLLDLDSGIYTVIAIDRADDPFCQSAPVTVEVTEERIYPVVTAVALTPLTICDPTRPNGVAMATVSGNVAGFQFDWFVGKSPFTAPSFVQGPQADGLDALLYSVIAKDIVTGCPDTTAVTVPDATHNIATSSIQVVVESNVTTCDPVHPNGALSASVDGNTIDYKFFWYNNDPGPAPDTTTAVFKGSEFYSGVDGLGLAVGTYYVSAVNRFTGCPGGPATGEIKPSQILPEFKFTIDAATCKRNETEIGDGFITIIVTNSTDVDLDNVTWRVGDENGAVIATGPNLIEADAGTYYVTVTTNQGCSASQPVELKSDIRPFNGISRNGDGMNDFFMIKCLEQFQDNIVRIFNRAGTLVFEAENYDNIDIYFDGQSNKGVSMMGHNLPDGTYFYIIDKRDGSKPVAGYLEIVN